MTNHELGSTEYRPSYCPECGNDHQVAVSEDDEVRIICECTAHDPEDFIEELNDQLPIESTEPEMINKKDKDSKGFQ